MDQKAFYNLTYGLFLLTAQENGKDNGCIINTAIQVANDPTRLSIAAIKKNLTCEMILRTGRFNVTALTTSAPFSMFRRFGMQSGRDADKFADFASAERSENGLYRLNAHANAFFSCKVTEHLDLGSHILFIGEVEEAQVLSGEPSCTYGYYQSDIKPKPQKTAAAKKQWVCTICGYIYEGDQVPDDYLCPLCKHGKEFFVPVAEEKKPKKWVCTVCGYIHEGDAPPEVCPLCKVPASKFVEQT